MTTQDPELSAALGWPGGISDPVLDRKTLLQQVAALRAALAQQAEPVGQLAELQAMLRAEVDRLIAAGIQPQRKLVPLTEEEIYHATGHCGVSKYTAINIARAVEKASWEKNHGQA